MKHTIIALAVAGFILAPFATGRASAGGRFTLISDAACITTAEFTQAFVWWTDKDPSLAIFTFQPSGAVRQMEITRFIRPDDRANLFDSSVVSSTSVSIVLANRRGESLASVSNVPCNPPN